MPLPPTTVAIPASLAKLPKSTLLAPVRLNTSMPSRFAKSAFENTPAVAMRSVSLPSPPTSESAAMSVFDCTVISSFPAPPIKVRLFVNPAACV